MDLDGARAYLLSQPEAWEDYPFGPDVAVMKGRDKMFATLGTTQKCSNLLYYNISNI